MPNELSVRQWQERFKAGDFDAKEFAVQLEAGWHDWFCQDSALANRLKKISKAVMGITAPFILDNYYVWFKNNCLTSGEMYDDVRFEPRSGERDGKYFLVSLDQPYVRQKWMLFTERFSFQTPEFECANVKDMSCRLNALGNELEQGLEPFFIAEKKAAVAYIMQHLNLQHSRSLLREGEHSYSVFVPVEKCRKTIHVARSLENPPAGFLTEDAVQINGLYVCCPEIDEKLLSPPQKAANKAPKRKAAER